MAHRFFRINSIAAFLIFVVADLVCVGMGMGVPIFCIALGFVLGWYIAMRVPTTTDRPREVLGRVLRYATATSAFTFIVMTLIWGPTATLLLDPDADFVNFGIPMILYDPTISFVGWLVLMIFISPFLQLLTTLFSSHLTLLLRPSRAAEEA